MTIQVSFSNSSLLNFSPSTRVCLLIFPKIQLVGKSVTYKLSLIKHTACTYRIVQIIITFLLFNLQRAKSIEMKPQNNQHLMVLLCIGQAYLLTNIYFQYGQIIISWLILNLQRAMSIEINPLINRHLMLSKLARSILSLQ